MKAVKNKIAVGRLVWLLFFTLPLQCVMAANSYKQDTAGVVMTVAKVYAEKYSPPGTVQVTFYESARFYKLPKGNPHYKAYLEVLKEAQKKRKPVRVWLGGAKRDEVERVG